MLLNVCFIFYGIYDIQQQRASDFNDRTLYFGQHFIAYLELGGLVLLLAMAALSALYLRHISMTIDVVSLCGSWSSFKLFYHFRPQQLFVHMSSYYTQNTRRLTATQIDKTQKMRALKAELDTEIAYLKSVNPNNEAAAIMERQTALLSYFIEK